MKKVFPVIIVLIALSLVGIIILQISWLNNLLQVQEQKFLLQVDKATFNVAEDLSKQVSSGSSFRLRRKPVFPLMPDEFSLGIGKQPTIAERYSAEEINTILANAFNKEGLKNLRFEFAITSNSDDYMLEMQSPHFQQESLDTTHYKQRVMPVFPQTGSDLEGLIAYEHLFILIPDFKTQVWQSLTLMIIGCILFTIIIFTAFYLTLKTMLNQRKLSAIKSDFINNMTHEFKTPLATISLAVDALKNEKVLNDKDKLNYFRSIIKDENKRMNRQVETILQAALMEKQDLQLNFKPLHAHEIINQVLDNYRLQLQSKNAATKILLAAKNDLINADEIHFANLLSNLIDNAIKYSKENLMLTISTQSTQKNLIIKIEDNGIGMSKETTKRIFEKFYRAHTGNLHNVKGFGLGMSYVKTIIDEHNGKIKVDSTIGKGSIFTIEIPLISIVNPVSEIVSDKILS
ncbi:MAG: HAMP domain-containing sensor histidine kinase [Parafilimonas sp.]